MIPGLLFALIGPLFSIFNTAAAASTGIAGIASAVITAIITIAVPIISSLVQLAIWFVGQALTGMTVIFSNTSTLATISVLMFFTSVYIHKVDLATNTCKATPVSTKPVNRNPPFKQTTIPLPTIPKSVVLPFDILDIFKW